MDSWKSYMIFTRQDGSYVITYNRRPYHVPNNEEFAEMWKEVNAYANFHPEQVAPEPVLQEPNLTPEEQEQVIRNERSYLINEVTWLIERYNEQKTLGIETSNTEEQYRELLTYRQALRDITKQQGFPWGGDIEKAPWPPKPKFII